MSSRPSGTPSPAPVGEAENEEGALQPVVKTVGFACMAGAMTWTVARSNTAKELMRVDEPSEIALHLLITVLLLVSLLLLLAMALTNCVHALGGTSKFRRAAAAASLSCQEKQHTSSLLV